MQYSERNVKKQGCRWWLWGGIAVVILSVIAVVAPDSPNPSSLAGVGAECEVSPEKGAWFAMTDQAYDDLVDAQNANSGPLMGRLLTRGVVFREPKGSHVLVVRVSWGSAWCRVTQGANQGDEGWVQRELITPLR